MDQNSDSNFAALEVLKKSNALPEYLKEYAPEQESFTKMASTLYADREFREYPIDNKENTFLSKLGSLMGIKKEVISDNSDASIADMLIKGISMGILDTEKKLSQYDEKTDKKITNLAKKFISFQQSSIDNLKKYL